MQKLIKSETRKGAASFYAVIFAALVFTVIVVSFIRLMISEAAQNTANDLSQSAYDAALMGVEDAKAALAKCGSDQNCLTNLYKDDCDQVSKLLYGQFQTADSGAANSHSRVESVDQAYTCVKLRKDLEDYKVRFTNTRTTVIPIENSTRSVKISWLHKNDDVGNNNWSLNNALTFPNAESSTPIPPVVSAGLIENNNPDHINMVVLRPSSSSNTGDNSVQNVYSTATDTSRNNNRPAVPNCINGGYNDDGYACEATINGNGNSGIRYLVLSLPYKESNISFRVVQYSGINGSGKVVTTPAQIAVDSTGRANDYYRRVEVRLQPADINFPYPDYALSSYGGEGGDGNLIKNFWVTKNCWTAGSGSVKTCNNNNASD